MGPNNNNPQDSSVYQGPVAQPYTSEDEEYDDQEIAAQMQQQEGALHEGVEEVLLQEPKQNFMCLRARRFGSFLPPRRP